MLLTNSNGVFKGNCSQWGHTATSFSCGGRHESAERTKRQFSKSLPYRPGCGGQNAMLENTGVGGSCEISAMMWLVLFQPCYSSTVCFVEQLSTQTRTYTHV